MIQMIFADISVLTQSDIFWVVLVVLLALACAVLASAIVAYVQKQGLQQRVGVEICNRSNVACRYEVRAESALPDLNFAFTLDGKQLAQQEYSEKQTVSVPIQQQPAAPTNGSNGAAIGGIGDAAQRGVATVGAVARLMMLVGAILPGQAARSSVSQTAMRMYNVEWTGRRAMQVPQQMAQVGQMATGGSAPAYTGAASGAAPAAPTYGSQVQIMRQSWAQTSELQPGGSVCLELLIRPLRVFGGGTRSFSVLSRPTGLPSPAVVSEQGTVILGSASRWRRYAPYILIWLTSVVLLGFVLWAMLA